MTRTRAPLVSSSLRWLCGRLRTASSSWCPSQGTSRSSGSFWLTGAWGLWLIISSSTWPSPTFPWRPSTPSLTLSTRFTTTGTLAWATAAFRTSFQSQPCSHPSTQWLPSPWTGEKSPPTCCAGSEWESEMIAREVDALLQTDTSIYQSASIRVFCTSN